MASLTDYLGLKVLTPDPTGAGGLAIQNDLKEIADRLAASRYVRGLRLTFASASTVSIGTGDAISDDGSFNIHVPTPMTVDLAQAGANGRDAGPERASTVYHVYVITDTSDTLPVAGLLSRDASSPAVPSGYDRFRRIGFVVNDAGSDLLRFHQCWDGLTRRAYFAEGADATRVLAGGSATSFRTVDCSAFVPSTARSVVMRASFINNAAPGAPSDRTAELRADGDVHDGSLYAVGSGVGSSSPFVTQVHLPIPATGRLAYRVTDPASALALSVTAVDDEL